MNVWDRVRDELHQLAREVALEAEASIGGLFGASGIEYVENCIARRTQRVDECLARIRKVNEEAVAQYEAELGSLLGEMVTPLAKDEVLH